MALQSRNDEEDGEGDGASYQLDMMRCLREVNVDNNTVGWCSSDAALHCLVMDAALLTVHVAISIVLSCDACGFGHMHTAISIPQHCVS